MQRRVRPPGGAPALEDDADLLDLVRLRPLNSPCEETALRVRSCAVAATACHACIRISGLAGRELQVAPANARNQVPSCG